MHIFKKREIIFPPFQIEGFGAIIQAYAINHVAVSPVVADVLANINAQTDSPVA
jgi:hypothetical protein